ncbi:MAG TPA: alpha/beta fold hydrolase [Pyrinomonadaceae bacterium]|jgi:homoserine O-acetyltransferase|nr:alpha/beta fold hydrolase [Pyrinomonadaceae bacterium]
MKRFICVICGLLFVLQVSALAAVAQEQQFANLGDFKLQNGGVIRNCRIGYRTFGKLNKDKSNVIVFPTWAGGTTEQLKSNFGPGRLIDSTTYFVVAIDALSNGVSSSPSNSRFQPRMRFPEFTLRDTVASQHELLTRVLNIHRVKAVVGISMGGMQTFQWLVSYPEFMEKAIPIVGSPRLAPYDLMLWQAQIDALMRDRDWRGGNYSVNPARALDFAFGELLLTTPADYNRRKTREQVFADLAKAQNDARRFDANDKIRQVQAMMQLDVSRDFDGSLERAVRAVKAKVFVVVAKYDHVVTPGPATEFARLLGAKLLDLDGDCGHLATSCESRRLNEAVNDFLR